ncbi:hypothetical protein D9M68_823410 [compost metagenome]
MVSIWIMGARTTMPKSMAVCADSEASPPATSDTSNEVPPMSPLTTSGKPAARAMAAQAITPAAGPESAVRTGTSQAVWRDITPPLLCTTSNSPSKPLAFKSDSSRVR